MNKNIGLYNLSLYEIRKITKKEILAGIQQNGMDTIEEADAIVLETDESKM